MKTIKFTIAAVAFICLLVSCGNKQQTSNSAPAEQAASVMDVDALLANADSLVGKEVVFDGVCTHACKHGATKIFMIGSDDTKSIRVEAAKLGSFDTKCINNIVKINGFLREERIDEAYLLRWEAKAKAQSDNHGDGEGGCSTEKNARGETANTVEGRIADFRVKIAANYEKTGKDYLSFYFVEAVSYEIQ